MEVEHGDDLDERELSFLGVGLIGISFPLPSIYRTFQSIYRLENTDKRFVISNYVFGKEKPIRQQRHDND